MNLRYLGAILLFSGCCGCGFWFAWNQKRETVALRELESVLEWMICQLEYHMTPLPELIRSVAQRYPMYRRVFAAFADQMESFTLSDVGACMENAIRSTTGIHPKIASYLQTLGNDLGSFALTGQVMQLRSLQQTCAADRAKQEVGQDARLRSYRTLGICAGLALAILLL